jgi:hypothetical protein
MLYYEEGDTKKSVSPDVFVVHGVDKKQRRTYLTWAEGKTPDFVLEVSSHSTAPNDIGKKKELYAEVLGVKEYYIYDPEGELVPHFIGYRLVDGVYEEIEFVDSRLPSSVLGLELGERGGGLRLYNPRTREWLQPPMERADQEADARQNAEHRAQQEADARQNAEHRAQNAEHRAQQEADARQNAEHRAQQEADARQNAEHRAQQEADARQNAEHRAQNAEHRAQQEADARQNAEEELAEVLAELQRLRARTPP